MESETNEILVDQEDEWLLHDYTWHVNSNGYVATRIRGSGIHTYLHHAIMGCPIWYLEEIDHRNRNPTDNRRENLRWLTHSQNLVNTAQKLGKTGARGVTFSASGRYMVQVKRNGINHYLGSFDTLDEAVAERNEWLHERGEL